MMKKIFYILVLLALFINISCEKLIDVNLNDVEKIIVIDAAVNNVNSDSYISLSYTSNYFDNTETERISGADIVVEDEDGNEIVFTEDSLGKYLNTDFKTKKNSNYRLKVNIEGEDFIAESRCPTIVKLDSIKLFEDDFNFGDEKRYKINCYFQDPPGEKNYYRFRVFSNGVEKPGYIVVNDIFWDGMKVNFPLNNIRAADGADFRVDLQSVNEEVYDYYYTLSRIVGRREDITPGNPISNIKGNAIGLFNPHGLSSKRFTFKTTYVNN